MTKSKRNFRVKDGHESKIRFQKRTFDRGGVPTRVSLLQEKLPVVYDDGSEGQEWIDVQSFTESASAVDA